MSPPWESFQLTAQTLIDIGGKKGYASEFDFLVAMLLASGKVDSEDVEEIREKVYAFGYQRR